MCNMVILFVLSVEIVFLYVRLFGWDKSNLKHATINQKDVSMSLCVCLCFLLFLTNSFEIMTETHRWDCNGADAVYIVCGLKSGEIDSEDKKGFLRLHKELVQKYSERKL